MALLLCCWSCTLPAGEADLVVVTANLLYTNSGRAAEVSRELMARDPDLICLIEAVPGVNLDQELLEEAGYACFFQEAATPGFNILIADRRGAVCGRIPVSFAGSDDPELEAPFASCRLARRGICLIGVHIPAPFYLSEAVRDCAFETLFELIEAGSLSRTAGSGAPGDLVILAGDFNSFPSDHRMLRLGELGMRDTLAADPDPYAYTWSPGFLPPVARIDYILVSGRLTPVFQQRFTIPGSDHQGVVAGVNYE